MKKFSIIVVLLILVIFSFILNEPISSLDELWNYSFSKNISDGLLPYKDFNLVPTPLLFFFTAVFLKFIFNGLIVTRILGAVLAVAILIMIYLILNKLLKNKYINIFILLNICLINIPFYTLDYNFLVLLFALIILNYELKGITLISLVVTIIIMLILAGVVITAVINGDGLFSKVKEAKETYENAVQSENDKIQNLIEQMEANMNGSISGGESGNGDGGEIPGEVSEISVKLTEGMVPVTYNESDSSWYVATEEEITNNTWFDYVDTSLVGQENKSKWANVMLRDNLKIEGVTNASTANLEELYGKKVTSEGSMYVWIPRYAYKIASGYHTDEAGEILIKFLNTDNTFKDGSNVSISISNPLNGVDLNSSTTFKVHPAFSWKKEDGTPVELEGIWVGKFEASSANASFGATQAGNVRTSSSVILRTVGNVSSWRDINRNNVFLNCYDINSESNASIYGISTNKNIIDPHLIKNTEWGAAAYLAHSVYGRNGTEVIANLSGYNTGNGNYKANVTMSTTGNVYGIYDMAGGSWEHVAAYVDSTKGGIVSNSYLTSESYGKALYEAEDKYKDVYVVAKSDGRVRNYSANADKYGDGIFETSYTSYDGTSYLNSGWYQDRSDYAYSNEPFFYRGSHYSHKSNAGIYSFGSGPGLSDSGDGFRISIVTI